MVKLKLTVVLLSVLLIFQTIAFVLFGLYYNDKNFRSFVEKGVFPVVFGSTQTTSTNSLQINEVYSYRIYGDENEDNLSVIRFERDKSYFLGSKSKGGSEDIWFFAVDRDGIIVKDIFLGKKGENEVGTSFDTSGNTIYLSGEVADVVKKVSGIWVVKLTNFSPEWDILLRGGGRNTSPVVKKLSGEDVVVAFSSQAITSNALSLGLVRISKYGDFSNVLIFPGSSRETPISVVELTNGDCWLIGESKSFGFGETDIFIVSIGKDGRVKWFKVFGTKFAESPSSAVSLGDGVVVSTSAKHFSLLKINLDGKIEWVKKYLNGSISSLHLLDKNLIATGTIFDPYSPNNIFIFEANENFEILWEESYSFSYDETPYAVFADKNFIYVGGTSYNDKTLRDIWFVKLKRATNVTTAKVTNTLVEYSGEINQVDVPLDIVTNISISSTNRVVFDVSSVFGLPLGLKNRFEKEKMSKKLEEKKKRTKKGTKGKW
ncbi:MAG: hypothetical protein ABDH28_05275 [Brevinematia bacterium]